MDKLDNTVSTKVADSTLERIRDHAESRGMSKSEAVRDCIRTGLDDVEGVPGARVSYGFISGAFGIAFLSAGFASAATALTVLGAALLVVAVGHDAPYWLGLR
jgi:hypothetical protein